MLLSIESTFELKVIFARDVQDSTSKLLRGYCGFKKKKIKRKT
jgi:hypothetical protein